ncbi:MAG: signal peptide peptidase SppA, partial [Solirubrobacterales bacterium]
ANPPYATYQPYQPFPQAPRRRVSGWRVLWGILFGLSVLANVGLFLLLVGTIVVLAGAGTGYGATVLRDGPRTSRIAVIDIEGIIDESQADNVYRQLKAAREDGSVKGVIVRVNSPGGTISASDRIYREIVNYRNEQGQPAVAFMQGLAASGGYYASVACEEIIAEPTAITGSIGVIMSHFVFQELLENKLGVQPVVLTKGQKKGWPSSFHAPTDEEMAYLDSRLLEPAYQRFVSVVKEGRQKVLSGDEVMKLADGSIYVAEEAMAVKLIDKTGYLDDAIATIKARVGIDEAQVIEYRRPLSFMDVLMAESKTSTSLLRLDQTKLLELGSPQVLYLWHAF